MHNGYRESGNRFRIKEKDMRIYCGAISDNRYPSRTKMTIDNVKVSRSRRASREDRKYASRMATFFRRRRDMVSFSEIGKDCW